MKNSLLYFSALFFIQITFAQVNPVQNLEWTHTYDSDNYYNLFSLYWEEPEMPHDELLGYNIYAEDQLFLFLTETDFGCNPNFGESEYCDFIDSNGGDSFTGYVTAVYESGIESESLSFEVGGVLLNILEINKDEIQFYPNPAVDIIQFNQKLNNILLFDANGNQVKFIQKSVDELNISDLPAGVYLLKAKTISGNSFEKKFIKK